MNYRDTLNLPKTAFKMKANLAQREPEMLRQWEEDDLYQRVQEATAGRPLYVLHDGPPYANGHIHLGTAFNKVLKDIILRSRRMAGFHCPYVPGWDCHGLPIEHNVDAELGAKKREIDKLAFRAACRRYAEKWIDIQRQEFKRLGVLGDWRHPYRTIDLRYEAVIAREFLRFLEAGAVVRSHKPVYWCVSCHTALAEAEVEYFSHASPSIYVKFPLAGGARELTGSEDPAFVVIWTTTPWTLPANLAVALHPEFEYAAVRTQEGEILILAAGRLEAFAAETGLDLGEPIALFPASSLAGRNCRHPFMERDSLIITADYVTLESGTGCVHTAPGHGREDYLSGLRYGLPILSPVDGDGVFTDEAGPYAGLPIQEANGRIVADLAAAGLLVRQDSLTHSYPHCWRCKKPVIFRATAQWFISMEANDLRRRCLEAIRTVGWVPRWGSDRILGMVESRPDWCLSRQRAWGVPLTVILCRSCGAVANTPEVNQRIVELFAAEGADAWFRHPIETFTGPDLRCPACGGQEFEREEDILDVWFDSGVSYAAVLEERSELASPADLYLEGSDQHRGWFQSSLIAAVGTRGRPPYKNVLTHGFVVDGRGHKMSKSEGNVVAPAEVIKKYGADILRLWVASEDYRDDIKISDNILEQLADAYRKIRNTIRFLLGNLFDFDPAADRLAYDDLEEIDRWALARYEQVKRRVSRAYDSFDFHHVFHAVYNFCTVTLSSLYLDIQKDQLYTAPAASRQRRSAQTACYEIVEGLLCLMAPVLCFTAEEAWRHLPAAAGRPEAAALAAFPPANDRYLDEKLLADWEKLLAVRAEITRVLEMARRDKVIGHSLEARVTLATEDDDLAGFLAPRRELLRSVAIVSQLVLADELASGTQGEELTTVRVLVEPAPGEKCERCWTRSESVGEDSEHPTICQRCASVVRSCLG